MPSSLGGWLIVVVRHAQAEDICAVYKFFNICLAASILKHV